MKAIHFTNTQVYEYFPDWFRSGSMNSPITQVSIKLDRFIPFKVLQLVCMQKKTYPDAYFCMVKTTIPWPQQHSSASVVLRRQHVDKTRKSSKTNLIYEGSSCNLCNQPMVWLCPAGIKQKSPIQKNGYVLFITMKKK